MLNSKMKIMIVLIAMSIILIYLGAFPFRVNGQSERDTSDKNVSGTGKTAPIPKIIQGRNGKMTYVFLVEFWQGKDSQSYVGDLDGDVLILGSSMHINARIRGSLVSVGSLIVLQPGSVVEGNAVLFASQLQMGNPKIVRGKTVEYLTNKYLFMPFFAFFLTIKGMLSLFSVNSDFIFALFLMIFAKKRILSVCGNLVEKPSGSLQWGVLGIIVFLFLGGLFLTSIYTMVLVIILLALSALLFATAFASVAYLIGQKIEDQGWIGKREFIIKGLIGMAIIFLFQFVLSVIPLAGPYLAGMLGVIIRTAGVGATLMAWFIRTNKTPGNLASINSDNQ